MFKKIEKNFERLFQKNNSGKNNFFSLAGFFFLNTIFELSGIIISISVIILIISIALIFISSRKTEEEKAAKKIIQQLKKIKKNGSGKKVVKEEKIVETGNLKELLVKKFQPKIEKQLETKIKVKDFKPNGKNFSATIKVQDHYLEIILDSSGKIIDYKKL